MDILALFIAVGAAAACVYDLLKLMALEKRIEALEAAKPNQGSMASTSQN